MVGNNLFSGLFIKCSVSQKMQLNEEALNYGCFHPACFGEALLQAVGVSVGPPPLPPTSPLPCFAGITQALSGQAMQARGGDEGHLSVFRLRSTLGPFGPESSNLPEVAGTVLSPSPNCTVGTSDSPGCNVPSWQQGGMATPLSCWGPVATASFSCGLEHITPG